MGYSARDMDTADLAGQRLMVGFDGTTANRQIVDYIREYRVGGVILFSRNLENPEQIRSLLRNLQKAAADEGLPPLLLSVDQEGGRVERLPTPPYTHFAGNPFIATEAEADAFADRCAGELASAGFNMNLAPVVDVPPPEGDSIMTDRAFANDPEKVARLGVAVIRGLESRGVLACAKHFPGIGRTFLDSHHELPVCDLTEHEITKYELVPFEAAMQAGVASVMLSHILYSKLDHEWPASMSTIIARDLLRGKMHYTGMVFTDDLDMGAVAGHYSVTTAMERMLLADIDMALICHPSESIPMAFRALVEGLEAEPALLDRGRECVARILAAKARVGG